MNYLQIRIRAMRNFFIFLFITFLCSVILYFTGHSLLQSSLESRLKSIPEELEKLGISIEPVSIDKIRVNSGKSLSIKDIKTRFSLANKQYYSPSESFNFNINEAIFEAQDYSFKKLKLTLNNISIQSIQDDSIEAANTESLDSYDGLKFQYISIEFENADSNPEQATRALLQRFANYIRSGKFDIPIKFSGTVDLNRGGSLKLSFEQDFFIEKRELEKLNNKNFNATEIELLSTHPLRVGTFVELKEQANDFLKKANTNAPADAVRNIYYFMNLRYKFGNDADSIISSYQTDDSVKYQSEMAKEYLSKNIGKSGLLKIINEQGKNFPLKAKANFSLN
jgi:hypothetical protein